MQLFKNILDKLVCKYYKNILVASTETGIDKNYLYRFFKRDEEEIFIFLKKLILQKRLSPDDIYELITGTKYEYDNSEIDRLKTELERTKQELEREKTNLNNLIIAIKNAGGQQHENGEDERQRIKNIKKNLAAGH